MKDKAVILFSGGIDSTLCIALALQEYKKENVTALIIDYGQNNSNELEHSIDICSYYQIKYEIIDLKNIFKYSKSSLISSSNNKIPHKSYEKQFITLGPEDDVSTNVPFRNGVFFSVCTSFALSNKIGNIYTGIHKEDRTAHELYPDCSEEFNNYMALSIEKGTKNKVRLSSPLIKLTKEEIIKKGLELNIPFEKTWTCYENHEHACGKCNSCVDRLKAFKKLGIKDPVEYED